MNYELDDTIAAVSTPIGEGGIGIVRLSGDKAVPIVEKIFRSKSGKNLKDVSTYTTHYGQVVSNGRGPGFRIVDEVIVTVMRRPKTYTREDVVEINCHGGIRALESVLGLVIAQGARLARPGEFTMRAFLNGRIDLAQAEAVLDLIRAKTDLSLKVSLNQLKGTLSRRVSEIREKIFDIYAHIEAAIDFPEEEIDAVYSPRDCLGKLSEVKIELNQLLETAEHGLVLKEGVLTVICGRPNVGKSSLMNAFLRQDRVIVSPVPGTTRDTIEEVVNIKGIPFKLVDTAGLSPRNLSKIPEGRSQVEEEAERRSQLYLKKADLVLLVLDQTERLTEQDRSIMETVRDKNLITVLNKEDLPRVMEVEKIKSLLNGSPLLTISATQATGLDELEQTMARLIWKGEIETTNETLVTNVRHRQALTVAFQTIDRAIDALKKNLSIEFIALEVKEAINNLGLITGETAGEDLLDRIFSQFCIGK